jgi:hypothetical protein
LNPIEHISKPLTHLWLLPAAPQCLPQGVDFTPSARRSAPISWTKNSPSAYLIDSGLWRASGVPPSHHTRVCQPTVDRRDKEAGQC